MSIAENRRARYDYHIEEQFEAGVVLSGFTQAMPTPNEIESVRTALSRVLGA